MSPKYIEAPLPVAGDRVVVGLSGGVDSTVCALLLKAKGCRVIGVTMSLWRGGYEGAKGLSGHGGCYSPNEAINIRECDNFCRVQGIPYYVVDCSRVYEREVLDYYKSEYKRGRTPNPCVRCNRLVKFSALAEGVKALGVEYDYFATGHYANVVKTAGPIENLYGEEGTEDALAKPCYMIQKGVDGLKDQSYFLNRLDSPILERVRFPLGGFTKDKVYAIAREAGLSAAAKKESQDFIDPSRIESLFNSSPNEEGSTKGKIVDEEGKLLGFHRGIEHYTIGQRRGLGVSAQVPLYVVRIDAASNTIVLGREESLNSSNLKASKLVWAGGYVPKKSFRALAKIRYRSPAAECTVYPLDRGECRVEFTIAQRAITAGQSVAVYIDGGIVLGGVIDEAL